MPRPAALIAAAALLLSTFFYLSPSVATHTFRPSLAPLSRQADPSSSPTPEALGPIGDGDDDGGGPAGSQEPTPTPPPSSSPEPSASPLPSSNPEPSATPTPESIASPSPESSPSPDAGSPSPSPAIDGASPSLDVDASPTPRPGRPDRPRRSRKPKPSKESGPDPSDEDDMAPSPSMDDILPSGESTEPEVSPEGSQEPAVGAGISSTGNTVGIVVASLTLAAFVLVGGVLAFGISPASAAPTAIYSAAGGTGGATEATGVASPGGPTMV